jgi:hypothetical protein
MAGTLVLGPFVFQDFELPEHIGWGGAQRLTVHRLPGGARVIDAMGRDDAQIAWTGVFSGTDGGTRARLLDLMRVDGSVWPLTWDSFFYSVLIAEFRAEYAHTNWIRYRITCTVLRDEAEAVIEAGISLATNVLSDLVSASGLGTGTDLSGALAAAGQPGAATMGTANYGAALDGMNAAATQMNAALRSSDQQMGAVSLHGAGALVQTASVAGQLAGLAQATGFVQRAAVYLADASS